MVDDEPAVAATEFAPDSYELRLLRALLDTGRYPSTADAALPDIRWFTTGDFSIHYIETHDSKNWDCRWDCHLNSHNERLHFHEPPVSPEGIISLDLREDVYAVVRPANETSRE